MTFELTVPNLACSACVETVTKAVQSLDPVAQVSGDPKTKQVKITTSVTEAAIKDAITTAGYTVA
jgi:copper chaperone